MPAASQRIVIAIIIALAARVYALPQRIAIGCAHQCVLVASHPRLSAVYCWGDNSAGQCGHDKHAFPFIANISAAIQLGSSVSSALQVTGLLAGCMHTCAYTSNGERTVCWGDENSVPKDTPPMWSQPQDCAGDPASLGAFHACIRQGDGLDACWGIADSSVLDEMFCPRGSFAAASLSTSGSPEPLPSVGSTDTNTASSSFTNEVPSMSASASFRVVSAVSPSASASSSTTTVSTTASTTSTESSVPIIIYASASASVTASESPVAPSLSVSISASTAPTHIAFSDSPASTVDPTASISVAPSINGGNAAVLNASVAGGNMHTCVVLATRGVKCWGTNVEGQLGYDAVVDADVPYAVGEVLLPAPVLQIAAGAAHTCARYTSGRIQCWGKNDAGQLGYGHQTTVYSPASAAYVSLGEFDADIPVIQLAMGSAHTCALIHNGSVKCWGWNGAGQLGLGHYNDVKSPDKEGFVPLNGLAAHVAAGNAHTCVAYDNGSVKCWGSNSNKALGYGDTSPVSTPLSRGFVPLDGFIIQLTGGDIHTCALYSNGSVKCWGGNLFGQLGYEDGVLEVASPASVGFVPLHGTLSHISASSSYTCGLYSNGSVKCWGGNTQGQLGYGTQDVLSPAIVPFLPLDGIVLSIATGYSHVCVVYATAHVKCWGGFSTGQLGYDNVIRVRSPALVGFVPMEGVVTAAAGEQHTCAVTSEGNAKCWGKGQLWQLGYDSQNQVNSPESVPFISFNGAISNMTAGYSHSCALYRNASVKCWGGNEYGQLGIGHNANMGSPGMVSFVELDDCVVKHIVSGAFHNCIVCNNGSVKCWGWNMFGQLGYEYPADKVNSPATVGFVALNGAVSQLAAGFSHTCALYVEGGVKCWGGGVYGQLGHGNGFDLRNPATVGVIPSSEDIVQITAGDFFTCALYSNGHVKCWGDGQRGQLGNNATASVNSPSSTVYIPLSGDAAQLTAGRGHVCALLVNGSIQCWGGNDHGQLGYGHTTDVQSPATAGVVSLQGLQITQIIAGGYHTCAVTGNGSMKCWGSAWFGQVGYNTHSNLNSPAKVGFVPLA